MCDTYQIDTSRTLRLGKFSDDIPSPLQSQSPLHNAPLSSVSIRSLNVFSSIAIHLQTLNPADRTPQSVIIPPTLPNPKCILPTFKYRIKVSRRLLRARVPVSVDRVVNGVSEALDIRYRSGDGSSLVRVRNHVCSGLVSDVVRGEGAKLGSIRGFDVSCFVMVRLGCALLFGRLL